MGAAAAGAGSVFNDTREEELEDLEQKEPLQEEEEEEEEEMPVKKMM